MTSAAVAAAARYPQAISLDDPMVAATISPRLFGSHEVEDGYRLEASQKYPWPGKLSLARSVRRLEARAAGHDVDGTVYSSLKAPTTPSPITIWLTRP